MADGVVLVAGAGSWGTALAIQLARNGQQTVLWGHDHAHMARLAAERRNQRYLPGVEFPPSLAIEDELEDVLRQVSDVVLAVPCKALREVAHAVAVHAAPQVRISWACKGIDVDTLKLPHAIIAEMFGEDCPAAVISGPTFANEVAAGLPTAVVVASSDRNVAQAIAARLHGGTFRTYVGTDVMGVEIGGAVKNVLAIAAGISDGLGFGANSRAALITRGLAELTRLGVALGANPQTLMGLAGLGDLVLTCTQDQSRNRRLGLAVARGKSVAEASAEIGQVVEGVRTADALQRLSRQHKVDMPISDQVARVLRGECTPREAVQALLAREPKSETM
ncbi:MAG: NAD(P)H-dependent glycerol-3-phosphate dehydrogenase [Gammaproteobacteria bacterium]